MALDITVERNCCASFSRLMNHEQLSYIVVVGRYSPNGQQCEVMLLMTPKTTVAKAGIVTMEIVKMSWIQRSSTDAPLLYGFILPIGSMGFVYLLTW